MRKEGPWSLGRRRVNVSAVMEAAETEHVTAERSPRESLEKAKINHVLKITVYK